MVNDVYVSTAKSGVVVLRMDKPDFLGVVTKIVDLSPVFKEWNDVKVLKYPEALRPPQLWDTLHEVWDVIEAVCSAVEVAKTNFLREWDPNGERGIKFDRTLALAVAVDIILCYVKFGGVAGMVVNSLWRPLLNLLVSIYINGKPSDWLDFALKVLRLP